MVERSKLPTSFILLFLIMKHCVTQQSTIDPFYILRSRTFRVVIRVKGRDPSRHLTTYDSVDGVKSSPLLFGFPPSHRRRFMEERMEIFDATTTQEESSRKITLRHPWHDVYLTWDQHRNIRGCSGAEGGRNQLCSEPPYLYMENWVGNTSQTATANSCFKLRLMTSRTTNESFQQVAYLHVTRRSWEIKLKVQRSILTRVLAETAWRAWEGVLEHVFADGVKRHRKSAKRLRRCAIDIAAIRHRFVSRVEIDTIREELKRSLKKNKDCLLSNNTFANSLALINQIPWIEMTSSVKSSLTCHVSSLVRTLLRSNLLELADTSCIRGKRWGQMSDAQRHILVDRALTAGWRRWEGTAHQRLNAIVGELLDDEVTTFCADTLT